MKTYNQQHNVNAKQLKKQSQAFRKLRMQKGHTLTTFEDKEKFYGFDNSYSLHDYQEEYSYYE